MAAPTDGRIVTPVEPGLIDRVVRGVKFVMSGDPTVFFGPGNPLKPQAQGVADGRAFDFPFAVNTRVTPRATEDVSFSQLRALADGYDLMRLIIETRKDQVAALPWTLKMRDEDAQPNDTCKAITEFFAFPDQEHSWDGWLRMLLEDMFVIDAACIYPRMNRGGGLYGLELVDGGTIKRVIDETGRTPMPPDPAYQQIIKGLPAVNYNRDELIYMPRNPRTNRIYGYSHVEQVVMTVNIALRRQIHQLQFYTEGNLPDALISTPENWQPDQIRQFQLWFDSLMDGNTAQRRKAKFVPAGVDVHDVKAGAIGDDYDEWLARVVCFCFSIPATAFTTQTNRATADTTKDTATAEGLLPVMKWVKSVMDYVIGKYFGAKDIEFAWGAADKADPLVEAQIAQIYLTGKVLTPNEVRDDLGLDPLTAEQQLLLTPPQLLLTPPPPPGMEGDSAAPGGGGSPPGAKGPPRGADSAKLDKKKHSPSRRLIESDRQLPPHKQKSVA